MSSVAEDSPLHATAVTQKTPRDERERGEKTETKSTCLFVALRGQENVLKTKSFVQCSVYQSLSPSLSVSFPFTSVKILF